MSPDPGDGHHLLVVPVGSSETDATSARLWELGATGIEERPATLVAAFADRATANAARNALGGNALGGTGEVMAVAPGVGLDAGRDRLAVVRVGDIAVHPPWLTPPADTLAVSIDPGHAFGSGSHPTTRLALALLHETLVGRRRPGPAPTVLDVGCGSGVLALTAVALGARVEAVDVDPAAVTATVANAEANGVAVGPGGPLDVRLGSVREGDGRVDVAVVNTTVDVHELIAPAVRTRTDRVVVSGVLAGPQEERVIRAYDAAPQRRSTEGAWAGLVLRGRGR